MSACRSLRGESARFIPRALLLWLASTSFAVGDDWPQWNGPTRDGVVAETGVLAVIPEQGLELLWRHPVGLGYSGPAAADGRLFVMDYQKTSGKVTNSAGSRDRLTGKERLLCFDASDGELVWQYAYDRPYAISYPSGPRATPTIHNGLVYALGAEGDLTCLEAATGELRWKRNFADDYGAPTPLWGHAASPLVYQDALICMVGGEGSLVVAFDLQTGKERWRSLSAEQIGYCPPSVVHRGGVDQLLIWDAEKLSSLNPESGQPYWQFDLKPAYGMSILPPVVDDDLLYAAGEGNVSIMLRLARERPEAEILWRGAAKQGVYLSTAAAIFTDDHLYGSDIRSGALVCVRAANGERLWQTAAPTTGSDRGRGAAHGSAFLLKLDQEQYLIFSETGDFISAKLSPEGYQETGRFHAIDPTGSSMGRDYVWSYPAVADGRLFLRNDEQVVCYRLQERP